MQSPEWTEGRARLVDSCIEESQLDSTRFASQDDGILSISSSSSFEAMSESLCYRVRALPYIASLKNQLNNIIKIVVSCHGRFCGKADGGVEGIVGLAEVAYYGGVIRPATGLVPDNVGSRPLERSILGIILSRSYSLLQILA